MNISTQKAQLVRLYTELVAHRHESNGCDWVLSTFMENVCQGYGGIVSISSQDSKFFVNENETHISRVLTMMEPSIPKNYDLMLSMVSKLVRTNTVSMESVSLEHVNGLIKELKITSSLLTCLTEGL